MMKNIGASITGVADTENRKINFSAFFMFGKNTSMPRAIWSAAAYGSDGVTRIEDETAKLHMGRDGVLTYDENVSTDVDVYIRIYCVAYYPDNINRQHIDYWFRFAELLG